MLSTPPAMTTSAAPRLHHHRRGDDGLQPAAAAPVQLHARHFDRQARLRARPSGRRTASRRWRRTGQTRRRRCAPDRRRCVAITSLITAAHRCSTATDFRLPPKAPTAVRTGATMAALLTAMSLLKSLAKCAKYAKSEKDQMSEIRSENKDFLPWRSLRSLLETPMPLLRKVVPFASIYLVEGVTAPRSVPRVSRRRTARPPWHPRCCRGAAVWQ